MSRTEELALPEQDIQLSKLMGSDFYHAQTAKEKDIVLVLGNTGSGKSTLINYLLGNELKRVKQDGRWVIEKTRKDDRQGPRIGHTDTSETRYPDVYRMGDTISLCDCPGFDDTREAEQKIADSIQMQLVVKYAKSIQGIIIVIDYSELSLGRGEAFRKLSLTLGKIFTFPEAISNSILFVVTKADSDTTNQDIFDQIVDKMSVFEEKNSNMSKTIRSGMSTFFKSPSAEQYSAISGNEQIVKVLKLIIRDINSIVVIHDITGISIKSASNRATIRSKYNQLNPNPISIENFNFNRYDDARVKFDTLVVKLSNESNYLIERRRDIMGSIRYEKEKEQFYIEAMQEYQNEVNILSAKIKALDTTPDENTGIQEVIRYLKQLSLSIAVEIGKRDAEMVELLNTIREMEAELNSINVSTPVLYQKERICERRAALDFLGWTRKTFYYEGPPIVSVQKIRENPNAGSFHTETEDYVGKKTYQITYESNLYQDGIAEVNVFIENRHKPEYELRIKDLTASLELHNNKKKEKLMGEILELKKEMQDFESKIHALEMNLNKTKETVLVHQASLRDHLALLKAASLKYDKKIGDIRVACEDLTRELESTNRMLDQNEPVFSAIKEINAVIEFNSSSVNALIDGLKKLKSDKTSSFEDKTTQSSEMSRSISFCR